MRSRIRWTVYGIYASLPARWEGKKSQGARVRREWRWYGKATNGQIVAASTEGYASRAAALRNLFSVSSITPMQFGALKRRVQRNAHVSTHSVGAL